MEAHNIKMLKSWQDNSNKIHLEKFNLKILFWYNHCDKNIPTQRDCLRTICTSFVWHEAICGTVLSTIQSKQQQGKKTEQVCIYCVSNKWNATTSTQKYVGTLLQGLQGTAACDSGK